MSRQRPQQAGAERPRALTTRPWLCAAALHALVRAAPALTALPLLHFALPDADDDATAAPASFLQRALRWQSPAAHMLLARWAAAAFEMAWLWWFVWRALRGRRAAAAGDRRQRFRRLAAVLRARLMTEDALRAIVVCPATPWLLRHVLR